MSKTAVLFFISGIAISMYMTILFSFGCSRTFTSLMDLSLDQFSISFMKDSYWKMLQPKSFESILMSLILVSVFLSLILTLKPFFSGWLTTLFQPSFFIFEVFVQIRHENFLSHTFERSSLVNIGDAFFTIFLFLNCFLFEVQHVFLKGVKINKSK